MDYVDTNWYILNEVSILAQQGTEVDLNDIEQYLVFQDIVQLRIKWDIWNKKVSTNEIVRNQIHSVLSDISYLIEQMRQTLTYMIQSKMG